MGLEGTLSTSPTEINADATLTVLVNCRDAITSGDQIELVNVHPGSFSTSVLSDATACSLSNEFTGWLSITACDVTSTSVKVTLEPIFDAALFNLEFSHFTNPPSAGSATVTVKRYKNGELYEEADATLTGMTPLSMTGATITALSD